MIHEDPESGELIRLPGPPEFEQVVRDLEDRDNVIFQSIAVGSGDKRRVNAFTGKLEEMRMRVRDLDAAIDERNEAIARLRADMAGGGTARQWRERYQAMQEKIDKFRAILEGSKV